MRHRLQWFTMLYITKRDMASLQIGIPQITRAILRKLFGSDTDFNSATTGVPLRHGNEEVVLRMEFKSVPQDFEAHCVMFGLKGASGLCPCPTYVSRYSSCHDPASRTSSSPSCLRCPCTAFSSMLLRLASCIAIAEFSVSVNIFSQCGPMLCRARIDREHSFFGRAAHQTRLQKCHTRYAKLVSASHRIPTPKASASNP